MKQLNFLFLLFCLLTSVTVALAQESNPAAKPDDGKTQIAVKNPQLRDELLQRMKADQDMRKEMVGKYSPGTPLPPEEAARFKAVDRENTDWMKKTIDQYGFPGNALVGKDGAAAAFVLVQHADHDLAFQKKALEAIRKAVDQKDVSSSLMAYLTDRILIAEGKPQKYGTQINMSGDGNFKPSPIEDEANVDKRRAEIGLSPVADYIKLVQSRVPKPKS